MHNSSDRGEKKVHWNQLNRAIKKRKRKNIIKFIRRHDHCAIEMIWKKSKRVSVWSVSINNNFWRKKKHPTIHNLSRAIEPNTEKWSTIVMPSTVYVKVLGLNWLWNKLDKIAQMAEIDNVSFLYNFLVFFFSLRIVIFIHFAQVFWLLSKHFLGRK